MVFTTYIFVFYFLPIVLAVYYLLLGSARLGGASVHSTSYLLNCFLLVASYFFYGWRNPWLILLMLFVTIVNYCCGIVIGKPGASPRWKFWAVTAGITISLGVLAFFKYFMFFQTNLNHVLAWFGADTVRVLEIVLPMGISFYTFHALSYSIDVYRGKAPPVRSFVDFACYIALFPQLVAGPIIRYNTVADQLVARSHSLERFSSGVSLFASWDSPRRSCWPIRWAGPPTPPSAPSRSAPRTPGSACWPTPSRFISTSPAIQTWQWGWAG